MTTQTSNDSNTDGPFWLTEEQQTLRRTVRSLASSRIEPLRGELDTDGNFVWSIIEEYRRLGFYGIGIPENLGGQGGGLVDLCVVAEELARADAVAAIYLLTPLTAGPLIMMHCGSTAQMERWLPGMAQGNRLTALALTEAEGGSDAGAITTTAQKDGTNYRLSGRKIYVSLGNVADDIVIFARTGPRPGSGGLSAFLVPRDTPGLTIGRREKKMGFHAKPTVEILLDEVIVSVDRRLGDEGSGFKLAMKAFNWSRVAIGALAVGLAAGALNDACTYIRQRKQFGVPISEHQGIQFMVADLHMQLTAARALTYEAAMQIDRGSHDTRLWGAMTKCFATDMAMKVCTDAVQLYGGAGYCSDAPVEKRMRDAKLLQIFEGTNQIQRMIIGRDLMPRSL